MVTSLLTTRIFLTKLSVIETTHLADRMLRFMLLKVVFLGAIVNPADAAGYLLWACFTAFQKAFVGLAKDRGEALLSSPTATVWQHMRCASLLALLLVEDAAWIVAGVRLAGATSPFSWAFLWLFDAACVGVEGLHAGIRYLICGLDRWRAQRGHCDDDDDDTCTNNLANDRSDDSDAEGRSQFLYLLDLGSDLVVHALNLVHYGHILHLRGGLRMQLIDVALLTDVRFLIAACWRRGQGHIQYRKLTHKLRYCFPDAPVEDLKKDGGVTCAICMENMRVSKRNNTDNFDFFGKKFQTRLGSFSNFYFYFFTEICQGTAMRPHVPSWLSSGVAPTRPRHAFLHLSHLPSQPRGRRK
jgi:hypothetical protein